MHTMTITTHVLLLVDSNPTDVRRVRDYLSDSPRAAMQIHVATSLKTAIDSLLRLAVDVVVVDLQLPDCSGVDSVLSLREIRPNIPIVVLTRKDDEDVALECIDAGAEDFLTKEDVTPRNLQRAIGYAITRRREAQLRELQEAMEGYRSLSSRSQGTKVTAALAGTGAVSLRNPASYQEILDAYCELLTDPARSRTKKEVVATRLGDSNGAPRDLVDIHIHALDLVVAHLDESAARALVVDSRLLALEMMGLLVDYYRVGPRRHDWTGASP